MSRTSSTGPGATITSAGVLEAPRASFASSPANRSVSPTPGIVRASCRPASSAAASRAVSFGDALQADRVRDDDDVALVEQVPVDVEQVVRHLPVAAVARAARSR